MILQIGMSAVGTIAFSLLFSVQKRYYVHCGLIGGIGWGTYLILLEYVGCSQTTATFFATLLIMFLSRLFAVQKQCPATVFIPGILPLIPGIHIYQTVYHLVNNQMQESLNQGFVAIKLVGAIILGIALIFELPNRVFRFFRVRRKK